MKIKRMKRFEDDEKARNVADLDHVIREFEGMASDLDRQIKAEEARTGVNDPARLTYSTFAKAASLRRDNLRTSAKVLRVKLQEAQRADDQAPERLGCAEKSVVLRPAYTPTTWQELRDRRHI